VVAAPSACVSSLKLPCNFSLSPLPPTREDYETALWAKGWTEYKLSLDRIASELRDLVIEAWRASTS
jgi:hypothetical protein